MTVARRLGSLRFTERGVVDAVATPPETVCPLCDHAQPRTVGDELPAAVEVACRYRRGVLGGWRRCATTHSVPADAVLVVCPHVQRPWPLRRPPADRLVGGRAGAS
ncbi:MAG: hypothetical protein ACRDRK_26145 [Pseudonocardia sp.]